VTDLIQYPISLNPKQNKITRTDPNEVKRFFWIFVSADYNDEDGVVPELVMRVCTEVPSRISRTPRWLVPRRRRRQLREPKSPALNGCLSSIFERAWVERGEIYIQMAELVGWLLIQSEASRE